MSKEAMKLALKALERMKRFGNTFGYRSHEQNPYEQVCDAITALQEALAQQALDKKAENARELGLDYEPDGMHHNKPQKRPQNSNKPVAWMANDGEIYKHECWPEHAARPLVFGDTSPPAQQDIQRLSALVRAQQITIDKLEAQRTWVGLTDDEILYCVELENPIAVAEEVEAKLQSKNT